MRADSNTVALEVGVPSVPASEPRNEEKSALDHAFASLSNLLAIVQAICLVGITVVVLLGIVYRYVIGETPAWLLKSDDIQTILWTWLIFLGVPRSLWSGRAIKLGLTRVYPAKLRPSIEAAGLGACFVFFGVVIWSYVTTFAIQRITHLPYLLVSAYYATLVIPIAAGLSILVLLPRAYELRRSPGESIGFLCGVAVPILISLTSLPPSTTGIIEMLVLLTVDAPLAVAMGVGGMEMLIGGNYGLRETIISNLDAPSQSVALAAIPLFLFVGAIFANSKLGAGLGQLVGALLGRFRGGTGLACIVSSGIFANITGSALADTAALGSIYIPEMVEAGYSPEDAAALQAAAGVTGVVFPPSILLIVFSSVAAVSTITAFKAAIIPGFILMGTMMLVSWFVARKLDLPSAKKQDGPGILRSLPGGIPFLVIPAILDGGILSGIFSPSESGAVALVVVLCFALTIGRAKLRDIARAASQALETVSVVLFILSTVGLINYGFVVSGVQTKLTSALESVGTSHLLMLLVLNVIFILVHELIEGSPAIILLVPLILPAVLHAGISPYQLAVVLAVNSSIGIICPPIGVPVFVSAGIAGAQPYRVFRRIVPYIGGSFAVLILVSVVPGLSTWLT